MSELASLSLPTLTLQCIRYICLGLPPCGHKASPPPPPPCVCVVQEELKHRSPVQAVQAEYGSVFDADTIARDICRGVERGKFLISHGFDGFLLSTITTGMSPAYHWVTVLTEVGTGHAYNVGFE